MKTHLEARGGRSLLVAAACALLLASPFASGDEATLQAALSGPGASGDPDGRGEATLTMYPETNRVEVRLTYSNIGKPTALHIRRAATGFYGNVVLPIVIESDQGGTLVGSRNSAKPNIVETILASPEEYYLVVITDEYPIGALRGRLGE